MTYDVNVEPSKPDEINETTHALLGQWARGDKADIMGTVDEQIRLLGGAGAASFPTTGPAKTYMSEWMAYKANRLFTVGSEWALFAGGEDMIPRSEDGKKVTVEDTGYRNEGTGEYRGIRASTDEQRADGMSWLVKASHLRPVDAVAQVHDEPVSQGNDEADPNANLSREELLAALTAERARYLALGQANATILASVRAWERDGRIINEALNEAADRRDMCGEYEEEMEKVAAQCERWEFEGREEEYEVTISVPVTTYATGTVTVMASKNADHSDIEEMALEQADSTNLSVDDYDHDYQWDSASTEVQ